MKIRKYFESAQEFVDYIFVNPSHEIGWDRFSDTMPYMRFREVEAHPKEGLMIHGEFVGQSFISGRKEHLLKEFKQGMYATQPGRYIIGVDNFGPDQEFTLTAVIKDKNIAYAGRDLHRGRDKGDLL